LHQLGMHWLAQRGSEVVLRHVAQAERLLNPRAEDVREGFDWPVKLGGFPHDIAREGVGIAYVHHVTADLPPVAGPYLGAEVRPAEMAKMQITIRVGRCAGDDETGGVGHGRSSFVVYSETASSLAVGLAACDPAS